MPYIGKTPLVGAYQLCDAITTSATATYNLTVGGSAVVPGSAQNCIVSLNGVIQAPVNAFTVSGSQITFASALTATDVIDFIVILGNVFDIGKPTDGSVTNASVSASAAIALSKLATTGTMTFASTIGVGGATPAASGAGITFPASVSASTDANTLDDYEEGTFTPAWAFSTSGSVAYNIQTGKYTKIGNVVYYQCETQTSSISSPSGNATITGLPFTSRSTNAGGAFILYKRRWTTDMPNLTINSAESNTILYINKQATNGQETPLAGSDFSNTASGNSFFLAGFYYV